MKLALAVDEKDNLIKIYLYYLEEVTGSKNIVLIGAASMKKISNNPSGLAGRNMPCIPNTYSIGQVYVNVEMQKNDFGKIIFQTLFYLADLKDAGITTDLMIGNTEIINHIIRREIQKPEYYKQSTPSGSTEFDFDCSTEDPLDDCFSTFHHIRKTRGEEVYNNLFSQKNPLGTTSSWRKSGIKDFKPFFDRLEEYHEFIKNNIIPKDMLFRELESMSSKGFSQAYSNELKRIKKEGREMTLRKLIRKIINESITSVIIEGSLNFPAGSFGSKKPHSIGARNEKLVIDNEEYQCANEYFDINIDDVSLVSAKDLGLPEDEGEYIVITGSRFLQTKTVPLKPENVKKIVNQIEDPNFNGTFSFTGSEGDIFTCRRT